MTASDLQARPEVVEGWLAGEGGIEGEREREGERGKRMGQWTGNSVDSQPSLLMLVQMVETFY